jgi:hypothetical protein
MLQQLLKDHEQLRVIAASLRGLLSGDSAPTGPALAQKRWTLTRQMLRHIAIENALMAAKGEDDFVRGYREHVGRWTVDRIQTEWSAFRGELGGILDALEHRMDREERDFYRPRLGGAA